MGYLVAQWTVFFSVLAGASSGLTGLLFVALSINLAKIVVSSPLVARAIKALATLVGVLLISIVCLVPGQSRAALACELVVLALALWLIISRTEHSSSHRNEYMSAKSRVAHFLLAQLATVPFVVAAVSLACGTGGGLYWVAFGVVMAILAAVLDAWVLLIEIQR